jgi:hypothetical protein
MIQVRAFASDPGKLIETELPLRDERSQCSLRLRCLPGATAIHLALTEQGQVRHRAEIPADGGEEVTAQIELRDGDQLAVSSPGRHVLTLAPDARYKPSSPLRIPPPEAPLDVALVIDGTIRSPSSDGGPLLADAEAWAARVDQLVALVEHLREGRPESRLAVLAFGDEAPPQVRAEDLLPRYRLFPKAAERRLHPLALEELRGLLLAVPATSGGDFVDAVPEALDACAQLRWRPEARKLAILFGDSPGSSILHPSPPGAEAGVRERDVDDAVLSLHDLGVEVVTLHQPSERREELPELGIERELLDFAAAQYRRLASVPDLAFQTSGFEPSAAAAVIRTQEGFVGREATWGELLEIC